MGDKADIDGLRRELAALQARVVELEATPESPKPSVTRRGLLAGLAGAGAAGIAGIATAGSAAADTGQNLVLGQTNTADATTRITHTDGDTSGLMVASTGPAAIFATTGVDSSISDPLGPSAAISAMAGGFRVSGVYSTAGNAISVFGENDSVAFPGTVGSNAGVGPGLGGASAGHGAQLYLAVESDAPTGPPPGYAEPGYVRFDAAGDLWICIEGGENGPWRWTRLLREDTTSGRVVPIAPTRVLDSRATGGRPAGAPAVPGQVKGPLKGGQALTLDLAGHGPIPADATAVIGNLTVTAPSYGGYLIARPSGSTSTSSALNWAPGATTGNAFTCQLGPAGLTLLANGSATQHYELIVDLTAYVT